MEEGAKRRLAGATVLVVFLVIFLPMLLEEDSSSPVSEKEMSIPPRPDFDQGYDASVAEGPVEPSESSIPDDWEPIPQVPSTPRELAPSALFDAPATAEPEIPLDYEILPEPAPEVVEEKPPPVESAPTEKAELEPETAPPPEPHSAPSSVPTQASLNRRSWVIQVTSLQDRTRAYSLVQDLRAKGFPAYLEEAEVNKKLWHRVRIGPEVGRKQIESMAASLEKKTGMKGQIHRYP